MRKIIGIFLLLLLMNCATQNSSKYSQIQYEAAPCFGFCPIFKLTVNPDRTAFLEAEHFTFSNSRSDKEFDKQREGNFKTTIAQKDYDKLLKLLDEVQPKALKNNYGNTNVTDLPTATLHLKFLDGSEKTISDYGKHGTEELRELYKFFESLPKTQQWKKID